MKEDKLTKVGNAPATSPLSRQYFPLNATDAKTTRNKNTTERDPRGQGYNDRCNQLNC